MKNNILIAVIVVLVLLLGLQTFNLSRVKEHLKNRDAKSDSYDYYQPRGRYAVPSQPSQGRTTAGAASRSMLPPRQTQSSLWNDSFESGEWDPFREMEDMQQMMNRMFRSSFSRGVHSPAWGTGHMLSYSPDVDLKEADKEYIVKVDLPGIDKDKINVKIQNNQLILSGQRETETQKEETQQDGQIYRSERSSGTFMRAMPLPADADAERMTAQSANGVLTIHIPRLANVPKTEKKIEVQ